MTTALVYQETPSALVLASEQAYVTETATGRKYMRVVPGAATKVCRLCRVERPIEEFYSHRRSADGKSARCIPCESRPDAVAQKRSGTRKYREDRRALLATLKAKPCMDCGGSFPSVCMQFDHRDSTAKKVKVSAFASYGGRLEDFLAEIEKCDLVCANCHAIRTDRRRRESLGSAS